MVMILMRPSEHSRLLAYVEELSETDRGAQSTHAGNATAGGGGIG